VQVHPALTLKGTAKNHRLGVATAVVGGRHEFNCLQVAEVIQTLFVITGSQSLFLFNPLLFLFFVFLGLFLGLSFSVKLLLLSLGDSWRLGLLDHFGALRGRTLAHLALVSASRILEGARLAHKLKPSDFVFGRSGSLRLFSLRLDDQVYDLVHLKRCLRLGYRQVNLRGRESELH